MLGSYMVPAATLVRRQRDNAIVHCYTDEFDASRQPIGSSYVIAAAHGGNRVTPQTVGSQ